MAKPPLVLATNALHADGAALLAMHARIVVAPDTKDATLRELAREADGIIVRAKLPDDIFADAAHMKGVVRHGVGLDFIPVEAATARGIVVANLPGTNTQSVAEYVFAALMHLRRPLAAADAALRASGWNSARVLAEQSAEIGGTTLGILGVGAIGSRVATIARAGYGMRVLGVSRSKGRMPECVEEVTIERLFGESDAIVLSCALTPETKGIVDARLIGRMKPSAVLINVSRGGVIVTNSLLDALEEGRIAGAALDVHDAHPLTPDAAPLRSRNLLLTPHIAAITATSYRAMSIGAVTEMLRILAGEAPVNFVNPECRNHRGAR